MRKANTTLDRFLSLSQDSQKSVLIIMDVMINGFNYGALEIKFPFGFRSVSEWTAIFDKHGFKIIRFKYVGFKEGNFSPNSHGMFVLDKQ